MSKIHESIINEIVINLKKQLTGDEQGDLLFKARPQRHYPIGNLSPETQSQEDNIYPSSCGFKINISSQKNSKIKLKIRGHYYIRREPSLNEQIQHLANQWQVDISKVTEKLRGNPRINLPYCWAYIPFEESINIKNGYDKSEIDLTDTLKKVWIDKNVKVLPVNIGEKSNYNLTEAFGRVWNDEKDYRRWLEENFPDKSPDPSSSETHKLVAIIDWKNEKFSFNVVNKSQKSNKNLDGWFLLDQNIYNLNFEINLGENSNLIRSEKKISDTFHATSIIDSWGEGKNLQLKEIEDKKIIAEPFGIIRSNRTFPKNQIGKADLSFSQLSEDPIKSSEIVLKYLVDFKEEYEKLDAEINTKQSNEAVNKITNILENAQHGINLLKNNEIVNESFKLMNETFYRRYINEEDINSWRGFQFIYLLGKLKEIINPDENKVDVIFVPTGGGKTETYFAFLITVLFYLRLKKINIGTVAIVKFPLRMLALDQIQRIAPLIALADMVRNEHPKLTTPNDKPSWLNEFSLGFMIGGSSSKTTPNRVHGYKESQSPDKRYEEVEIVEQNTDLYQILTENPKELKVLFKCPICIYNDYPDIKSEDDHYDTVEVSYDEGQIRAEHKCTRCGTRFAIHWTDEECFRYHPSIVISTQDRVAYSAFTPYMRGILGGPVFYCPQHGFSVYSDICSPFKGGYGYLKRECSFLKKNKELPKINIPAKDRALRYIIQDEMHLLKSDLGSLNSPFEKMLSDVVYHYSKRGVQYIGMSATVQGVNKQIKEIYGDNKTAWLFPGDPPCSDFSKNIEKDAFFYHSNKMHKLFFGCNPASVDPSTVVSKIVNSTTELINYYNVLVEQNKIHRLPHSLNNYPKDELKEALNFYLVNLGFMRTKIDLERTKQNLINIYNVERRKKRKIQKVNLPNLIVKELTGDNSIKDIKDTIYKIKQTALDGDSTEQLDVLLATNLVSHGIDLKEMNLMTFYGIPGSTAEYIQAMSRVGRKYPGLVFVVYHPNRARDRGLWRTFFAYHLALRQQVETMPVDHLAPGLIDQSLVTLLRCYWNLIQEVDLFGSKQGMYKLEQIIAIIKSEGLDELIEPATSSILRWLEWDQSHEIDINIKIEEYLEALRTYYDTVKNRGYPHKLKAYAAVPISHSDLYQNIRNIAKPWMSTMTGIRGIQPGISNVTDNFSNIYLESRDI